MARLSILFLIAAGAVALSAPARAQAPDVRDIRPIMLLLVDTSGSMERVALDSGGAPCACSTASCTECLPSCGAGERSRWVNVVEALTGGFSPFSCAREDRNGVGYAGAYDENYYLPHHRITSVTQLNNGLLDSYAARIRFGLMTFDALGTFTDETALVPQATFMARLPDSITAPGDFSYGEPRPFTFPGCATTYMLDNGARNESANIGRLVSVGPEGSEAAVNLLIQNTIMGVRPWGATPIAGMLEDARYYFANHAEVRPRTGPLDLTGDAYFSCRPRYILLLTDGAPNADMRGDPYFCDTPGYTCPYERPEDISNALCQYSGAADDCTGDVRGVYVVGYGTEAGDRPFLDQIALLGGTDAALIASTPAELTARIAEVLDSINTGTTTRSVPAFARGGGGGAGSQFEFGAGFQVGDATTPWHGVLERRRFQCSPALVPEPQPITDADRFHKVLNARGSPRRLLTVVPSDHNDVTAHLTGPDQGLVSLGGGGGSGTGLGQGGRHNYCSASGTPSLPGCDTDGVPNETDLVLQDFSVGNGALTRQHLGVATDPERTAVINWVHASATGTARDVNRLGDIYHSSPVIIGPPTADLVDESFNRFRIRDEVVNRPTVLYVGTNDGILHAFAVEDTNITSGPHTGTNLVAGEELWGFVPPILFPKLQSMMSSHQFGVDGTPIVRDVFFHRLPGEDPNGSAWHTVLIVPLGRGGPAYIALDVTDPLDPQFLWQFTDCGMGDTLGAPGVGQILVNAGGGGGGLQERAFALLPGGAGDDITSAGCGLADLDGDGDFDDPIGCPSRGRGTPPITGGTVQAAARARERCWDTRGRSLHFIDVATGEEVAGLDDRTFGAPLTGGVSMFNGETAAIATRAFVTDQDGVIWRLDMTSTNMNQWEADPFYDLFHNGGVLAGQPAFFAPVISTDPEGNLVILQGSGNQTAFDSTIGNRVASLTELVDFGGGGPPSRCVNTTTGSECCTPAPGMDWCAILNWEITLDSPGQQVTGPLELFNGYTYFATFRPETSGDACDFGQSFLWGVHYRSDDDDDNVPNPGLISDPATVFSPDEQFLGPFDNQIIMGVSVTQRPRCIDGSEVVDPYIGRRFEVNQTGGGTFQLVANVSGGSSAPLGGEVAQFTRELPAPLQSTIMNSLAGSVE